MTPQSGIWEAAWGKAASWKAGRPLKVCYTIRSSRGSSGKTTTTPKP